MEELRVVSENKEIDVIKSLWETLIQSWDTAGKLLGTYVVRVGEEIWQKIKLPKILSDIWAKYQEGHKWRWILSAKSHAPEKVKGSTSSEINVTVSFKKYNR